MARRTAGVAVALFFFGTGVGEAAGGDDVQALADPSRQAAALERLRHDPDPSFRQVLKALSEGALYVFEDELFVFNEEGVFVSLDGVALLDDAGEPLWPDAREVPLAEENIATVQQVLDTLRLLDPDPEVRKAVAVALANAQDPASLPRLEGALDGESDPEVKAVLALSLARLQLASAHPENRQRALEYFAASRSEAALGPLRELLESESEAPTRAAIAEAIEAIEGFLRLRNFIGYVFNGLSLASILLIMSLGLAVTFGLMGIINMAHGEMLMLGSYTAYVVQEIFVAYLPTHLDSYFIVALPLSVVVVGLVGFGLERGLLQYLYGRPLESLLVTWGIGMVLQQGARLVFGDQTSVNSPTWFRGGPTVLPGLVLPTSRIFIIVCSLVCLVAVYLLLYRSKPGLKVRAVMQNRAMAAAMGISTRRVDAWTFALGTALAGLAGCSLSLIGTVDPEVGKTYIVDSFMVVVLGGVGKLLGTVLASVGIGMSNKLLEPAIGGTAAAVYAKVAILALVILFLQFRPTGIFATRGRAAEMLGR